MLSGEAAHADQMRQLDTFPENNGNTYMLFSIVIVGTAPLCVLFAQQVNVLAVRILFAVYAALTVLAAFANIASFFWRTWAGQMFEASPPRVVPRTRLVRLLGRVPWRIWRLFDCYFAWNFAAGNVIWTFWRFDTATAGYDTFFAFCSGHRGCTNAWGAWGWSVFQAFSIFWAGSEPLETFGLFAGAFATIVGTVTWLFITFVFVAVVTQTVEITKLQYREWREEHGPRETAPASADMSDRLLFSRIALSAGYDASMQQHRSASAVGV
jgi:hypothetical protein